MRTITILVSVKILLKIGTKKTNNPPKIDVFILKINTFLLKTNEYHYFDEFQNKNKFYVGFTQKKN